VFLQFNDSAAKYMPFAFTEQGIAMLSGVLHSDVTMEMNISIMRASIATRQVLSQYNDFAEKWSGFRSRSVSTRISFI
jgi:hypothetical protein